MITYNNGIVKYLTSDFIVIEKIVPNFQKGNKYSLFVLEKNNTSLFNSLMRLSKILRVPISNFHFFGEKDKYAITKQIIYTPKLEFVKNEIQSDNFKLTYLFDVENITKDLMIGNKFFITVRKIKNQQTIQEKIEKIKTKIIQIPNYYDIQRFGKRYINHIIGYYLTNGKYFEATYLFLCAYSKNENHKVKKIRKKIKELFENQTLNIDEVINLKIPRYMDIEKIFLKILSQTRSYKRAWKNFPYKFTSLFKEAYFSYKFNEHIAKLIKSLNLPYFTREYVLTIPDEFKNLTEKFPDKIELVYPKEYLNIDKMDKLDSNSEEKRYRRNKFSNPFIYWYEFTNDEIFQNYQKLNLVFFLPRGEFATNLLNFLLED